MREALARARRDAAPPVESGGRAASSRPIAASNVGEPYDPRVDARASSTSTPARIAVGRTGPRYQHQHACCAFAPITPPPRTPCCPRSTRRCSRGSGCSRSRRARPTSRPSCSAPTLGRALSDEARAELAKRIGRAPTLVVIYGDGLSAAAINQHLRAFHGALEPALAARGIAHAPPFFVRRSRVKIMDEIARLVGAQAALFVCGERPGLGFADSLSAYYIYQPAAGATDADREVISNINPRGVAPARAARLTADAIARILRDRKSGRLRRGSGWRPASPRPRRTPPYT